MRDEKIRKIAAWTGICSTIKEEKIDKTPG